MFGNVFFNAKYEIYFDSDSVDINNIKRFNEVRNILKKEYYKDIDENVLLEGAIAGMANSLGDPYTVYLTKDQMKAFREKSDGSYVGIGVSVIEDKDGLLTVVEPFEGSPALEAGVQKGDKIINVDGVDVTSIRDDDVIIGMIRGKEGTICKITMLRPSEGRAIDFEIPRKRIKIANIKSEMLADNIGYIKIIMFDSEIASYFQQHLYGLLKQGMKGLIIDLRDNPGGSYDQVVKIADILLPEGLIVYTEDRNNNRVEEKSDKLNLQMPIAVLINNNSASASEILAGALKDHKKGVLVGTKTFGKGLVQAVLPLTGGAGIKVTVSRYFTPSGVCIQDVGIEPDVEVLLPKEYSNLPVSQVPRGEDTQLETAIQILKAKQQ
ncbi:MAG TPA: S41 family peptidase [Clostridiaceae bacterium]|nr:S41 family peptidase [Clostridiaceae bacterium]